MLVLVGYSRDGLRVVLPAIVQEEVLSGFLEVEECLRSQVVVLLQRLQNIVARDRPSFHDWILRGMYTTALAYSSAHVWGGKCWHGAAAVPHQQATWHRAGARRAKSPRLECPGLSFPLSGAGASAASG